MEKYSIDCIENGIAVLENIENGEKKEVKIDMLPTDIKEGSIVIEKDIYELDLEEEKKRKEMLKSRFNNLKKK